MSFVVELLHLTGEWTVSLLYEGKHVEGSPFNVRVHDPGQIRVIGLDGSLASRDYTFSGKISLSLCRELYFAFICSTVTVMDSTYSSHTIT